MPYLQFCQLLLLSEAAAAGVDFSFLTFLIDHFARHPPPIIFRGQFAAAMTSCSHREIAGNLSLQIHEVTQ